MIEITFFIILAFVFIIIPVMFGKGIANKFTSLLLLIIIFMCSNMYSKVIYDKTLVEKVYEISRKS